MKNADSLSSCENSWDATNLVVNPSSYMACLNDFLSSPSGLSQESNVLREGTPKKVIGFKQSVQAIYVESAAKEGVSMLKDM